MRTREIQKDRVGVRESSRALQAEKLVNVSFSTKGDSPPFHPSLPFSQTYPRDFCQYLEILVVLGVGGAVTGIW